jgi:hypothetical protein
MEEDMMGLLERLGKCELGVAEKVFGGRNWRELKIRV